MNSTQAQNMVERLLSSPSDAINAPMFNPAEDKPEGYLGWGAICLGASSVGIRLSFDDLDAAVALTKKLNDLTVDDFATDQLEKAYNDVIRGSRFLKPQLVDDVARAAARLAIYYQPVKKHLKGELDSRQDIALEASASQHRPGVFLSYVHEDTQAAVQLYAELSAAGLDVWFSKESLLPGQEWKTIIKREIRERRYFIAVLSRNSVTKRSYVQKELHEAFAVREEYPASSVTIIPVRLDDCIPSDDRLLDLHWVNMFENWTWGVDKILKVIRESTEHHGDKPSIPERA